MSVDVLDENYVEMSCFYNSFCMIDSVEFGFCVLNMSDYSVIVNIKLISDFVV